MFSTAVTVAIPDNSIGLEIKRHLNYCSNVDLILFKSADNIDADLYIIDNEEYIKPIRQTHPLASIFVVLRSEDSSTLKKLLNLQIDGIIELTEIKIQPVIDCIQQHAESNKTSKNMQSKLALLKESQRQLSFG